MAKKIITYTLIAEIEVDTKWYDDKTDAAIKKLEKDNACEWAFDNIKSEKITIKNA